MKSKQSSVQHSFKQTRISKIFVLKELLKETKLLR